MLAPYVRSRISGVRTSAGRPAPMTTRFRQTIVGRCAAMPLRSCVVSRIARPRAWRSSSRCRISWRRRGVDAGRRLVHEQEVGLAEHRARDEDALLLAAGQLPDVAVAQVLDVQPREHLADGGALGGARPRQPATVDAGHEHALLDGHREAPVDRLDLRHVGHPQALAARDAAADRLDAPGDRAQQRRLAAARRADDADELALADDEVDVDEHVLGGVAAGHARELRRAARGRPRSLRVLRLVRRDVGGLESPSARSRRRPSPRSSSRSRSA